VYVLQKTPLAHASGDDKHNNEAVSDVKLKKTPFLFFFQSYFYSYAFCSKSHQSASGAVKLRLHSAVMHSYYTRYVVIKYLSPLLPNLLVQVFL